VLKAYKLNKFKIFYFSLVLCLILLPFTWYLLLFISSVRTALLRNYSLTPVRVIFVASQRKKGKAEEGREGDARFYFQINSLQ
jgi:hypothetical protein